MDSRFGIISFSEIGDESLVCVDEGKAYKYETDQDCGRCERCNRDPGLDHARKVTEYKDQHSCGQHKGLQRHQRQNGIAETTSPDSPPVVGVKHQPVIQKGARRSTYEIANRLVERFTFSHVRRLLDVRPSRIEKRCAHSGCVLDYGLKLLTKFGGDIVSNGLSRTAVATNCLFE